MRWLIAETSFLLIAAILKLWGRRWISTATSRVLTTAVMRGTIWLLAARQPDEPGAARGEDGE